MEKKLKNRVLLHLNPRYKFYLCMFGDLVGHDVVMTSPRHGKLVWPMHLKWVSHHGTRWSRRSEQFGPNPNSQVLILLKGSKG